MILETESLTNEQWHFKPSKDAWSIAQVVEHLGLYERIFCRKPGLRLNCLRSRNIISIPLQTVPTYPGWQRGSRTLHPIMLFRWAT
ncbi:MAG: DinB family protein [Saprospiraceae bacterium]|nr:DinB family protein [Saprospiraceae bacterium]